MPDSATPSTERVATERKPKRHFDLAATDAAATASARDDAPSVIRATTKPAAAPALPAAAASDAVTPEITPVTPAAVARKPIAMIPLVAAPAPSGSADTADNEGEAKSEGGCCGGGCCS